MYTVQFVSTMTSLLLVTTSCRCGAHCLLLSPSACPPRQTLTALALTGETERVCACTVAVRKKFPFRSRITSVVRYTVIKIRQRNGSET